MKKWNREKGRMEVSSLKVKSLKPKDDSININSTIRANNIYKLATLNATQQLEWVILIFKRWAKWMNSTQDIL